MTRSAAAIRGAIRGSVAAALLLVLGACGGGASTQSASTATTRGASGQGDGRPPPGSQAFVIPPGCTQAVGDGKDYLAVGCAGAVSRLDPSTGKALWAVRDPTWAEVTGLELGGDVVVAAVEVTVPASGLTAKEEGRRIVALADGKKIWETKLFPPSPSPAPRFATTAEVTVVAQAGGSLAPFAPTVAMFETGSGRPRFERAADKAKCASLSQPRIFKGSVAACGERYSLSDGTPMTFKAPRTLLGSDPASEVATGQLDNNEVAFSILRSDGTAVSLVSAEFLGFAGGAIVAKNSDSNGRVGKVLGVNPDGSGRWEQAVTFDAQRGYFDNLSFANGAVWVRNASNELVAIDGSTGRPSDPLRLTAGLSKTAKVMAVASRVVVVRTGDGDRSASLTTIAR